MEKRIAIYKKIVKNFSSKSKLLRDLEWGMAVSAGRL
jgi:hypothetical protein